MVHGGGNGYDIMALYYDSTAAGACHNGASGSSGDAGDGVGGAVGEGKGGGGGCWFLEVSEVRSADAIRKVTCFRNSSDPIYIQMKF